jgi:Pyruvate/2-oxoacid:ferredoxin oxidoreductase delta subunit
MSIPLPLPLANAAPSGPSFRVVLYEGAGAEPLDPALRGEAVKELLLKGFGVSVVRAGGTAAPITAGTLVVLGKFSEAKPDRASNDSGVTAFFRDPTGKTAAEIVELVAGLRTEANIAEPPKWKPWFPVIDYDRCTNCMQCLSFCLFGVYGVDPAGRIQAQQQDNCKTNCPACSRVCPEAAIMFPKYKAGPINGDAVSDSDLQREKMKIDISALLGGDVYALLRDRSERARSRFGKERDSDKALAERQKCLTKLGEIIADLPPEVIASLPSPDQIARKAEEARARAATLTGIPAAASPTPAASDTP